MIERTRTFEEAVCAEYGSLRAFAISLCKKADRAEDLVQDTILRALMKAEQFEAGTNLRAWLFTILRNNFLSQARKRSEMEDPDGIFAQQMAVPEGQSSFIDLKVVYRRLRMMPKHMRDAMILVAIEQYEYADAAKLLGVPTGTVKSRVSRGRTFLENGEEAILVEERPVAVDDQIVERVRRAYVLGADVSEIVDLLPGATTFDVMFILVHKRIRGRIR